VLIASSFSRVPLPSRFGLSSSAILARVLVAPADLLRPFFRKMKEKRRVKKKILDSRWEILTIKSEQKKRRRDH